MLADELTELGCGRVAVRRGGVAFGGSLEDGYRACLGSRIASRVLMPLTRFAATDGDAFYAGIRSIAWHEQLGADRTLAVDTAGGRSPAGPPQFLALKAKDAIVDAIREVEGRRPNVDTRRPDLRVHLHLGPTETTVSLDLAGRGLHHRGLARAGAEAPLRETLAAALLRLAGWPGEPGRPLFDPFCGSGTFLIEAAWMALDVAPGLRRRRFGAEGWRGHDAALWRRLLDEAERRRRDAAARPLRIAGSDASDEALTIARDRLVRSELADRVTVERRALGECSPPWSEPGLLVCNPPYGERVQAVGPLGALYERLGDVLRRRFNGWTAFVLSGNRALDRRIGLRPASRRPVWNGPIECRWLEIPIHAAPVAGDAGPGWRRPSARATPLERKLRASFRERRRSARRWRTDCFRVYDSDIPEFNVAIDWFGGVVRVEEYDRPAKVDDAVADQRLADVLLVTPVALGVEPERVVLQVRRSAGATGGAVVPGASPGPRVVEEAGLRFGVDLFGSYDPGLEPGERLLRSWVRQRAKDRTVLSLCAGSCTASLAAAAGGALETTSVDRSNRQLERGRANFALNGLDGPRQRFVRSDVLRDLRGAGARTPPRDRYGLVLLSPPRWAEGGGAEEPFVLQRDHAGLVRAALARVEPGGSLLFWIHERRFELDPAACDAAEIIDWTAELTPLDFERRPTLRAWELRPA